MTKPPVRWDFDENDLGEGAPAPVPGATDGGARDNDSPEHWLSVALGLTGADSAFPWQQELLARFKRGEFPRSLDIPTGLGKTAVMALWLVARAQGAPVPTRLVYVVDRRAVVDQATQVAMSLRSLVNDLPNLRRALELDASLPISTLRGRHVDNREWLETPKTPAIIVGTVDMIGSRLLFEGYGVSRKMRPYHAGLLGTDSMIVLDESHLVPPFQRLLETIADDRATYRPADAALARLLPPFRLICLSATGRRDSQTPFGLQEGDLEHPVVRKRIEARKRITFAEPNEEEAFPQAIAKTAWSLSAGQPRPTRCLVFTNSRDHAEAAHDAVRKLAREQQTEVKTELLVGSRRVRERDRAARELAELGFLAGTPSAPPVPTFLFATSAGEVGVDLDADHMVSDLVAWERMVQRLGRVNRRGTGAAEVVIVPEAPKASKAQKAALQVPPAGRSKKEEAAAAAYEKSASDVIARRRPFEELPEVDGGRDGSPGALRELAVAAARDTRIARVIDDATTPVPLRPELSRALVDAWSMTSLKEHAGRPIVGPWLRGWQDEEANTTVVWRTHLPVRTDEEPVSSKEVEDFFEAAPPHASELLETQTYRVVSWLERRLERSAGVSSPTLFVIRAAEAEPLAWSDLADAERFRRLAGATLIVDSRLGGLSDTGLLDSDSDKPAVTADDGNAWYPRADSEPPVVGFRIRVVSGQSDALRDSQWRPRLRFRQGTSDEEEESYLVIEKWRASAETEDDRSAGPAQPLEEHQSWTEARARALGVALALPGEFLEVLAIAGRLHDEGKRAPRWQRAFHAPAGDVYAKTLGPVNTALLDGYRHEFGSLPYAERDPAVQALSAELRDLVLHLIASHHGFARPVITTKSCADAPPSVLEERARDVALRFLRLQRRWGPWGLAWWEALLRSADQQASRDNERKDQEGTRR